MKQYEVIYICINTHTNYLNEIVTKGSFFPGVDYLSKEQIDAFKSPNWAIHSVEGVEGKDIVALKKTPLVPVKTIRYLNRKATIAT